MAGNFIIDLNGAHANASAYATATHYKEDAQQGKTWKFVGSYDFELEKTDAGWRINSFIYHLKYATGNMNLE